MSQAQVRSTPQFASLAQIAFIGLFITALVTAQVISSKLIAITLPFVGLVAMPGGTLAYAATFFATDCISELYGKDYARKVVNVGFLMNFVLFILLYLTATLPAAQGSIDPEMFSTVMLSSGNIILGSLMAYIVSQNFDVSAFHWYKRKTDGKYLWLRNLGSTGISQFIDTMIFTVIAFWLAPQILGIGHALPIAVLTSIILGQYFGKLLIAVGDTPFVYAAVRVVKNRREAGVSR